MTSATNIPPRLVRHPGEQRNILKGQNAVGRPKLCDVVIQFTCKWDGGRVWPCQWYADVSRHYVCRREEWNTSGERFSKGIAFSRISEASEANSIVT